MRRSPRSRRNILLWLLSLLLVASMVCGLIISILGNRPQRTATPTPYVAPTIILEAPTATETQPGPQPSPQPLTTSAP